MRKKQNAIISTIRENNRVWVLVLISAFLVAISSAMVALYLQYVIDNGITADTKTMVLIGISGVGILFASFACNTMYVCTKNWFARNSMVNLKNALVTRVVGMRLNDFGKKTIGDYISVINNDLQIVESSYIVALTEMAESSISLVTAVMIMFLLNWQMTLIVLALCAIPGIVSVTFGGKLQFYQASVSENNSKYTSFIKEILSGISVIKSFFLEKMMSKLADEKSGLLETLKMKLLNLVGLVTNLCISSSFLIVIVIFVYGIMLTRKNLLSVGGIMAFVQLLNYVTAPMGKIFGLVQQIIAAKPVLTKVSDILEYECVTGQQIEKHDLTDAVEINNLTFTYESNHEPTLSNINLRFEKGKSYALVGLSGSGKSTLMHILAGYYDQFEGSVLIDGVDFRSISEKSACQLISFVQQDCFVFDDTILNNVCLYKKWDDRDVQLALNRAGLRTLIDARGIDAPCGENGALLSGGEKQRISIARALLCGSPIILLDEATSALDAQTTEEVEKAIAAIENTTRIVITHKMNAEILKRYDSIILMRDGIVTNQGTYDQLVEQNGWFRSMCETN